MKNAFKKNLKNIFIYYFPVFIFILLVYSGVLSDYRKLSTGIFLLLLLFFSISWYGYFVWKEVRKKVRNG
ncbi:MAG: hypothetical protein L6265_05145 [Thermoplasmatales archaeon]|nr:hypothetical protein [Thermoplasmatales archaeon]